MTAKHYCCDCCHSMHAALSKQHSTLHFQSGPKAPAIAPEKIKQRMK